jgi:hypothetical protein
MKKITKLDQKYLVVKREDLEEYFSQFTKGLFTTDKEQKYIDKIPFNTVIDAIRIKRTFLGKKENSYLVLNLDDKIDIRYLLNELQRLINRPSPTKDKVRDIAVDLVNAILKSKDYYENKP